MSEKYNEKAKIEVSVVTAGGILPVSGANVVVTYKTLPGMHDGGIQTRVTDENGKAGIFELPVRRAVIGGKRVDFPRRAECDVEITAEGYVSYRARSVHLFPGVTVMCTFDLLPKKK